MHGFNMLSSPVLSPKEGKHFTAMLLVSLFVHFSAAGALLLKHHDRVGEVPASYIDLTMAAPTVEPEKPLPVQSLPEVEAPAPDVEPTTPPPQPSPYEQMQRQVDEAIKSDTETKSAENLSFAFGMTSGYFSTLAEGKTLRPDIREYYLSLLQRVNEMWWLRKERGAGSGGGAIIDIVIARDGTLVQLEMTRGSGNTDWDRAILQTLKTAGALPPLPDTYEGQFFKAPLRFVAPLNLMIPKFTRG